MTEKEFLIKILMVTPNGATFESSEYISYEDACKLGLRELREFIPSSVGLIFEKNSDFEQKLVDFLKEEEITQIVTHFRIYKDDILIASSHDFPDFNSFDPKYYSSLEAFNSSYEVKFSDELSEVNINPNREIILHNVKVDNGVFSLGISLEIDDELFSSRIEIDEYEFKTLKLLFGEFKEDDILKFKGACGVSSIGLTVEKSDSLINLMVDTTPVLSSNLRWLQKVKSINEIKELGLKDPNKTTNETYEEKVSFLRRLNPFNFLRK